MKTKELIETEEEIELIDKLITKSLEKGELGTEEELNKILLR